MKPENKKENPINSANVQEAEFKDVSNEENTQPETAGGEQEPVKEPEIQIEKTWFDNLHDWDVKRRTEKAVRKKNKAAGIKDDKKSNKMGKIVLAGVGLYIVGKTAVNVICKVADRMDHQTESVPALPDNESAPLLTETSSEEAVE